MSQKSTKCSTYQTVEPGEERSNLYCLLQRVSIPFYLIQLLTLNLAFFTIVGCGLDVEDPTPPDPPQWVPKSLPEEWPERGIDAHESGGIILEWEKLDGENISMIEIFRAAEGNNGEVLLDFIKIKEMFPVEHTSTSYLDRDINTGITYHYQIKALDDAGIWSDQSETIQYHLLSSIPFESLEPNGADLLDNSRNLNWTFYYNLELEYYVITLLDVHDSLIVRTVIHPHSYTGARESWFIPDSIELKIGQAYKWRIDAGAKNKNFRETQGSESRWATFIYSGQE